MCVSAAEMARRLGLTRQAVHEAIRRGAVHAYMVGRVSFIPVSDLEKYRISSLQRPGRRPQKK